MAALGSRLDAVPPRLDEEGGRCSKKPHPWDPLPVQWLRQLLHDPHCLTFRGRGRWDPAIHLQFWHLVSYVLMKRLLKPPESGARGRSPGPPRPNA